MVAVMTDEKVIQKNNNGVDLGAIDDKTTKNESSNDLTNNGSIDTNTTNLTDSNIDSSAQKTGDSQAKTEETVRIYPVQLTDFDESQVYTSADSKNTNLNLLMNIPLELSVEIGRTKKRVKDILDMRHGTIVEFDKQANDPVEILVNGQLVAKGNVVVIDDCFGVRVTEIISNEELFDRLT